MSTAKLAGSTLAVRTWYWQELLLALTEAYWSATAFGKAVSVKRICQTGDLLI
jgi:hypothetical protein